MTTKKIIFDASIHLGQFSLDEKIRIFCKNSQASLSIKINGDLVQGFYTHEENGWMDHIIWSIDRTTQDIFYPFMDLFYSEARAEAIPLNADLLEKCSVLAKIFPKIHAHILLTCAAAIRYNIDEIHSVYPEFKNQHLINHLRDTGIVVITQGSEREIPFPEYTDGDLEDLYQNARKRFSNKQINIIDILSKRNII